MGLKPRPGLARQMGHAAADKAVELKDKAVEKYEDMRKPDQAK
jgi:hypothetical protein